VINLPSNLTEITIFFFILFFEAELLHINYVAREKGGFIEQNKLWRWFDKRGLMVLTIPIHVAFVVGFASYALLTGADVTLGFIMGALGVNFMYDSMTWHNFQQAPSYIRCADCGTMIPTRPAKCPTCEKLH
jgi:hypothetical protein